MKGHHHHDGEHDHSHGHGHSHHHDLNLKAAYIHVLADAVTSVLAILALTGGKFFGWTWLDPIMGIVGSGVIGQWAYGLVRDTNVILLDKEPESSDLNPEIRRAIEGDGDTAITDLHIWQIGAKKVAAIISVVGTNCGAGLLDACSNVVWWPAKKNSLFSWIGPPIVPPNWFRFNVSGA